MQKKIVVGVLCGILAAGMAGSITISAFTLKGIKELQTVYSAEGTETVDPEGTEAVEKTKKEESKEDGIVIAEQYEIRSTLPVSDAYKSGDSSKLTDKEKEELEMASKILDKIIKDGMSDYEKEKAVYDWMTKELQNDTGLLTVVPSSKADSENPYGVLKNRQAVCVGYATTFRLFMQMLGIDCKVVHSDDLYHSWNLVNIEGDWCHVDIYSDANVGNYANFNTNDVIQGSAQSWDMEYFPKATTLKWNVAYQKAKKAKDIYSIPKILRWAIDKKMGTVMIKFPKESKEEELSPASEIINNIDMLLIDNAIAGMPCGINSSNWLADEDGSYIFWVVFGIYNEEQKNSEVIDGEKLQEAIAKAFGDI